MDWYTFLPALLNMSVTAGVVILAVIFARLLLRKAPKILMIYSRCLLAVAVWKVSPCISACGRDQGLAAGQTVRKRPCRPGLLIGRPTTCLRKLISAMRMFGHLWRALGMKPVPKSQHILIWIAAQQIYRK